MIKDDPVGLSQPWLATDTIRARAGRTGTNRVAQPMAVAGENLSICRGEDGRVLLYCHHVDDSGRKCPTEEVVHRLGLTMADLQPMHSHRNGTNGQAVGKPNARTPSSPRKADRPGYLDPEALVRKLASQCGELAGQWTYHDADGREVLRVLRFDSPDGKTFRPIHAAREGWTVGDPPGLLPLYHLPELTAATRIYVTEGEKAADAVRTLRLVTTTSAHGAQSPAKSDWTPLAGKDVVILPDYDGPGEGYLKLLRGTLARLQPRPTVRVVRLPSVWRTADPIPEGGDCFDWINAGIPDGRSRDECRSELERVVLATPPETLEDPSVETEQLKPRARLTRASEIEVRPLEWLWEPRIPLGMLTLFAGDPKLGKSLSALAIAAAVSRGMALPMIGRRPAQPA